VVTGQPKHFQGALNVGQHLALQRTDEEVEKRIGRGKGRSTGKRKRKKKKQEEEDEEEK